MEFISDYKIYSKIKLNCNLGENVSVKKIMYGDGGSDNIIVKANISKSAPLIIKIFPIDFYHNVKQTPNFHELEIKFYKFFTNKYLLTNRTPHIVGIYNYAHCDGIEKLIKNKLLKRPCVNINTQLEKNIKQTYSDNNLCGLLLGIKMKITTTKYDMALIEYCDIDLTEFIYDGLEMVKDRSNTDFFIYELHVIFFQLIFTLAIIKDDYPGFFHGDLYLRNVLLRSIRNKKDNDYVAYHYFNKIFYLPANGIYAKINDFGMTVIANKIEPNVFDPNIDPRQKFSGSGSGYDPFDTKTDLYNFFIDFYRMITEFAHDLNISAKKINPIFDMLLIYFNLNIIDKISNKDLLDDIRHISNIDILKKTLKTPSEYLTGNHFKMFSKLPREANLIINYNLQQG